VGGAVPARLIASCSLRVASGGTMSAPRTSPERTFSTARHYGLLGGVRYAEPFVQKEVGLVDDLMLLPVQSI